MAERQSALATILTAVGCVWVVLAISGALVFATHVFLLGMLGVLFGIFLTKSSDFVARRSVLNYGTSLGGVVLLLMLSVAGVVYFFGQQIESRVQEAASHGDEAIAKVRQWVQDRPVVKSMVSELPLVSELLRDGSLVSGGSGEQSVESSGTSAESGEAGQEKSGSGSGADSADAEQKSDGQKPRSVPLDSSSLGMATGMIASLFRAILGAIMNLALVLFVGVFLATDPEMYRDGCVRLFPPDRRDRVREILNRIGETLWHWLLGRFGSMVITGVGTGASLALIGAPMPLTLGALTGLLTFIPNIGPAIGLMAAILVSLPAGSSTVVLVIVVFLLFQLLESYVLTPLIQQQQVEIPPAVLISWQVLLGMLAGFLGILVSTPILAVIFVVVKLAYLQDVLGDEPAKSET